MLFKAAVLKAIAEGRVDLAFRLWKKPTIKAGGTLRTGIGVLAIEGVREIRLADVTDADAKRAGFDTRDHLLRSLGDEQGRTPYRIEFHVKGDDPRVLLSSNSNMTTTEVAAVHAKLDRLDQRSPEGHWTATALRMIAGEDGLTAGEIARALSVETSILKQRIRQLKKLGLTESLQRGYRLSPRGKRFVTLYPARVQKGS